MSEKYGIHSEFDLQKHKETFVNYLKVAIHPDGSIHYTLPNAAEYLTRIVCKYESVSRDELIENAPKEAREDWLGWLCKKTGCVCVFDNHIKGPMVVSIAQVKALDDLYKNGLFEPTEEQRIEYHLPKMKK